MNIKSKRSPFFNFKSKFNEPENRKQTEKIGFDSSFYLNKLIRELQ